MAVYQPKHNFTAGEVSPLMHGRRDFDRFKNGCKKLTNMLVLAQGPVTRRSGFAYTASLTALGLSTTTPQVRMVPFVFNETQAYVLIFFRHTSGKVRLVFGVDDGLLVYPSPAPTSCPTGTPITVTPGDVVYIDMPTGWDIDYFTYAQSGDYLFCAQSTLAPHALVRHGDYCWTVEQLVFTSTPTEWSALNGWPETVTLIQQRLAFGGTKKSRQTIWMSRAGDFYHFGKLGATLVAADALTFTLDSGTQNRIVWMQTVKSLHVGTIGNEWVVSGNGQKVMTPTEGVDAESPTSQGSERVSPLRVGLTTLFVEQHGRVVNEFIFDYNFDSYKASDVTILAPHLTEDYSITRWTYQQTPNSIVWCVRSDGTLLGLTYQRQHNIVAWHPHTTDGSFIDVCAIPGKKREDDLWAIIKRTIGGVAKYYIEKKAEDFKGHTTTEGNFLDSHLRYVGAAATTLSGLGHLEGKEVYILANGAVHPPRTVSGGSITLNAPATNVLVGLYFESEVNPLLSEIPTQEGGSATRKQRIIGFNVELYRSLGFEIGTVDIDGEEHVESQPFRAPRDLTGQALPLFTGTYEADGFEGHDNKAEYFIRQRQPLPLTVIGVVDHIEVL